MANYKKLTDVEVMEEVSENTMALVEENGTLKKVPCGAGFGGGGPIKYTAIMVDLPQNGTFHCENMTFEEAFNHMLNGEIVDILFKCHGYTMYRCWTRAFSVEIHNGDTNALCITFPYFGSERTLLWSDDGDLYEEPIG